MNRKEYNKLQAEVRKQKSDMLKRFAESNPERFKELQEQARKEVELGEPHINKDYGYTQIILPSDLNDRIANIEKIAYKPDERHFFIRAKDKWGSEHLFCESFVPSDMTDSNVLQALIERHSKYDVALLVNIEACNCPACIQRHGS